MKHIALIPLAMLLAGCSSTPPPAPDTRAKDIEAIRAAENQGVADWASRDADRISRYWADDATLLMPSEPAIKGRAAIKEAVVGLLKDPKFGVTITIATIDVAKSGDMGYAQGTAVVTATDPKTKKVVTENAKYVSVYRKQADGTWRVVQDMNNADKPALVANAAKAAAVRPAKKGKSGKGAARKTAAKRRKR
jgi:uncharacterized protein (TIGR02246 family)